MTKRCPQTTCCAKPHLHWRGECLSNVVIECAHCGFVLSDDGQLADWHDPEQIAAAQEQAEEEVKVRKERLSNEYDVILTPGFARFPPVVQNAFMATAPRAMAHYHVRFVVGDPKATAVTLEDANRTAWIPCPGPETIYCSLEQEPGQPATLTFLLASEY